MLPIDPIKVKNAATGPTTVCASTARKPGSPSPPEPTNSVSKNVCGTNAAMMPATVKPNVTSFHTICHSMKYRFPTRCQPSSVRISFFQSGTSSSSSSPSFSCRCSPRLLDEFIWSGDADEEPGEADQEQPTQVLANDELPREEHGDDDAKLDDEIR